ncbi:hypothetical protein [Marinifilum sp. D737]|uniref:hypothetical protein n=1 Tax=Marinifilum sp. D737 TaxID=2969628 RepID=UPI0022763775|nr:hypothetical protein [Marinifilum sp. D737]MCY1635958.1 hypothetical protein [Marinifilum sp. D737]
MKYLKLDEKVAQFYKLIHSGYKASPKEFAKKLYLSERTFYRIRNIVEKKYGNLKYDRTNRQYYFTDKKV